MWDARLFKTTRGRILLLLKKRGRCTVAYLSDQLDLTKNAVRQHLSALERDGLVTQQPVRVGPSKPSLAYSLAPQAETLFPKRYDHLLKGLMQELASREGETHLDELLAGLGWAAAEPHLERLADLTGVARLAEIGNILEEAGAIVEWNCVDYCAVIRDYNCPYAAVTREHSTICQIQRSFLQRLLSPATVAIACQHLDGTCQFQVRFIPADVKSSQ